MLFYPIAGLAIFLLFLFFMGYKKASPDEALIISGVGKEPRVVIGKAAFCIPFLERADKLQLGILKIDVKTQEPVPTIEFINVKVDAVATIRLSNDGEGLKIAIKNFLNKDNEYINLMVNDVLEGNVREIIGGMELESISKDRKMFAERIQENAVPDMQNMGIDIVSFNVQNFTDENNMIQDLGMENIAKISKNASIVKAEAEKEVKIKQAEAELLSQEAQITAKTEIAQRENDFQIKTHELQLIADKKKAEADAAYKIEEQIQRKNIELTSADANLQKATKQIEEHSPHSPSIVACNLGGVRRIMLVLSGFHSLSLNVFCNT